MTKKIKAGIIGGAGYTGGEMIRLLINHPDVDLTFIHSRSNAGHPVSSVHEDLLGDTSLQFTDSVSQDVDVVFLCLGHGESGKFLEQTPFDSKVKIIDLSQDFRLGQTAANREFVYGLPELNRDAIRAAKNIANPGCFATNVLLGLLPLAAIGELGEVFATGITGSTGAGQRLQSTTHFTWRANNISAYKTLTHQHLGEIKRSLKQLSASFDKPINFVPWRGDFPRGIFVSACIPTKLTLEEAKKQYKAFYDGHPFCIVSDMNINLKQVINTNKCLLYLEKEGDVLVVHSALDNLVKGASGQAVQNMNLICGLDETAGLKLKGIAF